MSQLPGYNNNLDKCVENLKQWHKYINIYLEGDEKNEELEKLTKITKSYMEINDNFMKAENAIKAVESRVEDPDLDIKQVYQQTIQEQDNTDYSENIWTSVFGNDADVTEVTRTQRQLRDDQFESYDDSLLLSNVFTPPVDPISMAAIRNPVKNRICKHIYDSATIYDFISQKQRRAKCPYIGCVNKRLAAGDLEEDEGLKEKIRRFFEENQESDSE